MVEYKSDFDIYLSFGIILKGNADKLKQVLNVIETDFRDVKVVFTKTSGGRLTIVDE